ncbi:MAG: cupin domain-containing protein [Candidatus Diapherotrites archaeon]|nr:cupin domain-containing protein [Candidatus Diapherotrites archaeon]
MLVKSLKDLPEFTAGDNSFLREILNSNKEKLSIGYSLAWFRVLPKHKTWQHALAASEVYYIISGKGIMHIDKESKEVQANDTVYIPPNALQWIENSSETETLVALCIVDPAWKPELETVLE